VIRNLIHQGDYHINERKTKAYR